MNSLVTGLILAGGRSRRMGTDKGLVSYHGRKLIEWAIDILSPLSNELLISTSNKVYEQFGFRTVADKFTFAGPGGGIHAALEVTANNTLVVLSVDTPNMTTAFLSHLISLNVNADAVVPRHAGGFIEPLCAVYNTSAIDSIGMSLSSGIFKMSEILDRISVKYYELSASESTSNLFYNINSRYDLEQ
ncbi:MAG: hypothetical protein CVU06_06225 [Bacteroidetes bacterium HGW-Bacteroidetes-22]|nr:MAG: hypothetical protein CVU06_06225 [Bacteroidetes bacterium HGW-Bacteroidetes-22]